MATTRNNPSSPQATMSSSESASTPTTTPRKQPVCKTCHQPRLGHPKSGCPTVNAADSASQKSPSVTKRAVSRKSEASETADQVADSLSKMRIANPGRSAVASSPNTPRRRSLVKKEVERSDTLDTISTASGDILESLKEPGIFEAEEERAAYPIKKEESLEKGIPGAFSISDIKSLDDAILSDDIPAIRKVSPLVRTASADKRDVFLQDLRSYADAHPVRIFSVYTEDAETLRESADELGYVTRVVSGLKKSDKRLILGMDKGLVLEIAKALESSSTVNMRAAGAGAIVGAVAAFSGLAYT